MPSIVNGLFSGRTGLASHGIAIATIGDNVANVSTIGYKESRAEFADLVAGGQTSRITIGSGAQVAATTQIFSQGTLEFTGRSLDLAIDGNGYFAVADGAERYYTRAGNFKIDPAGFIVNQGDYAVLGFPSGGSGSLEALNVNSISQNSVATSEVSIAGNLDASTSILSGNAIPAGIDTDFAGDQTPTSTVTYAQINNSAEFSSSVEVFDSLGASHTINLFFFHTDANEWSVRAYVNSEEVDGSGSATGLPRQLTDSTGTIASGTIDLSFGADGTRTTPPASGTFDKTFITPWNNGSDTTATISMSLDPYTQFSAASNVVAITQDGEGVGNVTSISIDKDGTISALLDNGQKAGIGTIGLVNFANPEGLKRVGGQLLQQSTQSGAAVVGRPESGTFGSIEAGSVELSTVDIADQFVKLITLQRGFQANSRIITTINQLLNEIIQLA